MFKICPFTVRGRKTADNRSQHLLHLPSKVSLKPPLYHLHYISEEALISPSRALRSRFNNTAAIPTCGSPIGSSSAYPRWEHQDRLPDFPLRSEHTASHWTRVSWKVPLNDPGSLFARSSPLKMKAQSTLPRTSSMSMFQCRCDRAPFHTISHLPKSPPDDGSRYKPGSGGL